MKGLLIVDVQNDFCSGGSLEVKEADKILSTINTLIDIFNKNKDFIVATKDWHPADHKSFASNSKKNIGELGKLNGLPQVWWPDHCIQNTRGAKLHSELKTITNIVNKGCDPEIDSYSGFFDNGKLHKTELDDLLRSNNVDELFVVGLATDYCVKFTALDAINLGYKVNLVLDGCRGVNLSPGDSYLAIEEMKNKGVNIITNIINL